MTAGTRHPLPRRKAARPTGAFRDSPSPGRACNHGTQAGVPGQRLGLTEAMRARMTGVSWHAGCPVSLGRRRLPRLS
jgi:hypothetical protein